MGDVTTTKIPTPPAPTPSPNRTTYHYLGSEMTACIMVNNLVLAVIAISLNLVVMSFYRNKLNKTVPFIYFMLAMSDLCTGVCTGCHFVTFLVFLSVKAKESAALFWASLFSYFLTIVSFRLSAFVSLVFSVIRTMNIISPFTLIKKRVVMLVVFLYTACWSVVFLTEVVLIALYKEGDHNPHSSRNFLQSTFYKPGLLVNIHFKASGDPIKQNPTGPEMFLWALFVTIIPITLPAIISLILTSVQVYFLVKMDEESVLEDKASKNRQLEITIVMITLLFFICSSMILLQPLYWTDMIGSPIHKLAPRQQNILFYVFGYVPMFANAALNPVLLILRGQNLRGHFKQLLGWSQLHSSSVVLGNMGALAVRSPVTTVSAVEDPDLALRPQAIGCTGVQETAT
ncbi:hypothetical protein ACHWQZ_G007880 [Mnemiopsis leidyi]